MIPCRYKPPAHPLSQHTAGAGVHHPAWLSPLPDRCRRGMAHPHPALPPPPVGPAAACDTPQLGCNTAKPTPPAKPTTLPLLKPASTHIGVAGPVPLPLSQAVLPSNCGPAKPGIRQENKLGMASRVCGQWLPQACRSTMAFPNPAPLQGQILPGLQECSPPAAFTCSAASAQWT